MTTRFASLPPALARLVLGAIAMLVAIGLAASAEPGPGPRLGKPGDSDVALYRAIAARSDTLPAYYAAATAEQRARGYPLKPFVTVREPALALLTHAFGVRGTAIAWRLLALAAAGALATALAGSIAGRAERIAAIGIAFLSAALLAQPALAWWHEAWAGMLLVLAVAVSGGRRWWIACLAGLAALLIRELALPAIVMLLAAALAERRRIDAAGWAAAIALFAIAYAGHAAMVAAHVLPTDPPSPGWARIGGWGFVIGAMHRTSLFLLLPLPLVAVALPLALLGWAAPATPLTDRATLVLAAMLAPFMLIGRPDNFYWGLLVAPLVATGLAFAPRALADLARQAAAKSPSGRTWARSASS